VPEEGGWVVGDEGKVEGMGVGVGKGEWERERGKGNHSQEEGKPLVRTECDSERRG
jgi:hypothetical protein